jgi:acyl-CoA thioester hydrolase
VLERFDWPLRVYWEDTDGGGVVYHSVYLNYFERARSEWLRAQGIDQRALREQEHLQFVVVEAKIRWRRPALYDDSLLTRTEVVARAGASLTLRQTLWRNDEQLAHADVRVAAIDARTLRPCRLPHSLTRPAPP